MRFDPLTDPTMRGSYRKPRSAVELCMEKHHFHMQMAHQDQWLKQVMARADQRLKQDTEKQQFDFNDPDWMREQTVKNPTKRTVQKRGKADG